MDDNNLKNQDTILKAIESALYGLADKWNLTDVTITRWRWDQPEVMLVWLQGQIYRNIVAYVDPLSAGDSVSLAANMWIDCDEGGKRVRLWLPLTKFKKKVELNVNALSDEDLKKLKINLLGEVAQQFPEVFDKDMLTKEKFAERFNKAIEKVTL